MVECYIWSMLIYGGETFLYILRVKCVGGQEAMEMWLWTRIQSVRCETRMTSWDSFKGNRGKETTNEWVKKIEKGICSDIWWERVFIEGDNWWNGDDKRQRGRDAN